LPHLASKAKGHPSSRRTSNRVRAHTTQLALRQKSDFPNPFSASRKKGNPRRACERGWVMGEPVRGFYAYRSSVEQLTGPPEDQRNPQSAAS
jgi:hypothetical protein